MHSRDPNGYYAEDLIIYGGLNRGCQVTKGFEVHTPDLRNASDDARVQAHNALMNLLSAFSDLKQIQFRWKVDSDYSDALQRYQAETDARATNLWSKSVRQERFFRYQNRMRNRQLRRERLHIFLTTEIDTKESIFIPRARLIEQYGKELARLKNSFREYQHVITAALGADTRVVPLSDFDHFVYYHQFLNPSIPERFVDVGQQQKTFAELWDPEDSIQELSFPSDLVGDDERAHGFYLDGYYHGILVVKRWPHRTSNTTVPSIGLMHHLTGLPMLDYSVVLNSRPLPIAKEIDKSERQLKRNLGDYADKQRHELLTSARKMERKIERLSQGYTFPFESLMTIQVWAKTYAELDQKLNTIKNAVNSMNGAQTYEPALATSTRKSWWQTWPGWAGTYNNFCLYSENNYLADLVPYSSSFTGFLETAEALFDGTNGNLVGVSTFREGTPQHGVLLGMSGAGKSVFMEDLLSQTEPYYGYTVIIEEGNSHGVYAKTFSYKNSKGEVEWCRTINIKPDSNQCINIFDTQGAPLNAGHSAILVALASRMIGVSSDEDTQQHREALLTHYVHQLYTDTYESWAMDNPDKALTAARLAAALDLYRRTRLDDSSGILEAYADVHDLKLNNRDEYESILAAVTESDITRFSKTTSGERTQMEIAYSLFEAHEYPQLSALASIMRNGRDPSHDKEKVNQMADMLIPWTAAGGNYRLFDGVSNIKLTEKMAHFELGSIPADAASLKAAAYLLINGFVRQNLITRPRSERKRLIFEEAARTLGAKGGSQIVEEAYTGLRKFGVWVFAIVQQYNLFETSPIRAPVMNNSKNFFVMRQMDAKDVANIGNDTGLPDRAQEAVMRYDLPEYLPPHDKHSSVCYFVPSANPPLCGSVKVYASPEMLYVSSSNGEIYDKRAKQLAQYPNPIEGILTEANKK